MKQEQDAEPVALLKRPDGSLLADQFDGAGFVRGVQRHARNLKGASALVVGSGGRRLGHRRLARRSRRQPEWSTPRPWA